MPLRMTIPAAELSVSKSKWQKSFANDLHNAEEKEPAKKKNKENRLNADKSAYSHCAIIFLVGFLTSALILRYVSLEKMHLSSKLIPRPTFTIPTFKENQDHLIIIRKVLKLFGYTEVTLEDDWDLLWIHENPFLNYTERIMKLGPHQVLNHMPGTSYVSFKADLSKSGSPYMPPAFRLPTEKDKFLAYAEQNPDKLFVEKGNYHRNVSIKKPKDINLESNTTFVQEFITNSYLVDGYKFDMGVYMVITSADPLRLYIYTGDVMFRYCQEKYHPFDPDVVEKYVVGDDYRPTWKVPALKKYFNRFGGGMRAAFDAYVREKGQDPAKIWEQAEEIIRYTILSHAKNIAAKWEPYPTQNFFEILRADMIIDTNFKVHLMEINLSPNMYSYTMKHNLVTYEQVLYNALRLVGVGSPIKDQENFLSLVQSITAVTSDKSVASNLNECVQHDCNQACDEELACSLCITCMNDEEYKILAKTQREHIHRGDMKRIFPKPILDVNNFDFEEESKNLTLANKLLTKWFYHKCLYDRSWCQ